MQHLAVVFGDIRDGVDIPVRLHLENVADDVFGKRCPVDHYHEEASPKRAAASSSICAKAPSASAITTTAARRATRTARIPAEAQTRESEWLEIGLGAQILKDLGVTSIKLLSSRERHYVGLEGFGIKIAKTEIC